jgi:hypothetical protein
VEAGVAEAEDPSNHRAAAGFGWPRPGRRLADEAFLGFMRLAVLGWIVFVGVKLAFMALSPLAPAEAGGVAGP